MKPLTISSRLIRNLPPDTRYLIGVSGGRDSIALLNWLVNLGYKKLIVCHLNHQLRGRASDADARFVEKLAKKYQVDFELGAANVRALAKKKKMSIETAARDARYSFFAKAAKRHGREVSNRRIDGVDLTIVRPLLSVWRTEIDDYVREHRLKFREDASNKNLAPMRNRVRNGIIPYLEKILGRNIRQNIWRTAIIAAEEESWIDNEVPDLTNVDLSVRKLRALPVVFQRRTIMKWLRAQNISEVGFDVIERVRSLLDRDARIAKVNLPQDQHVRRRAGKVFIE